MAAQSSGAAQNSQSCPMYSPPANDAGPVPRAGLDRGVRDGNQIRSIKVRARRDWDAGEAHGGTFRRGSDDDEYEEEGQQDFCHNAARGPTGLPCRKPAMANGLAVGCTAVAARARGRPRRLTRYSAAPTKHVRRNAAARAQATRASTISGRGAAAAADDDPKKGTSRGID